MPAHQGPFAPTPTSPSSLPHPDLSTTRVPYPRNLHQKPFQSTKHDLVSSSLQPTQLGAIWFAEAKATKMACASESANPPGQGLPYPPGESKLELTPTELLATIFGQLSQNDPQSFIDLQNQAVVEADQAAHGNMRSLCLTSKRVDRVARPLLFRNITITSPTNLLKLYESLQESPQLGFHVKQLSFEILLEKVWPVDFLPLPSSRSGNLLSGWDEETRPTSCLQTPHRRHRDDYSTYCCDQILSCCYFEILRRTPRVHRLVLGIQARALAYDPFSDNDTNTDLHPEFMCRPFFKKVESATNKSITGEGSEFLPGLKSLQILGDPQDPYNMLQIATLEPLLRLPTLQYFACSQKWALFRLLMCNDADNSWQGLVYDGLVLRYYD